MYDNLFRFPQTVLQAFQTVTGNTTADPNLYIAEPGLNYPQMTGFNGSLIFTLNDGYEVEIPNDELSNPLRGIDTNGARVLQPNITEVGIFYQEAPLNTAVVGKVFLSQVSPICFCLLGTCNNNHQGVLGRPLYHQSIHACSNRSEPYIRRPGPFQFHVCCLLCEYREVVSVQRGHRRHRIWGCSGFCFGWCRNCTLFSEASSVGNSMVGRSTVEEGLCVRCGPYIGGGAWSK
jgi:hypothetical protein